MLVLDAYCAKELYAQQQKGGSPKSGGQTTLVLDEYCAKELFVQLAQALGGPVNLKKKGKKGKKGKKSGTPKGPKGGAKASKSAKKSVPKGKGGA
jgi:hypothetical protein